MNAQVRIISSCTERVLFLYVEDSSHYISKSITLVSLNLSSHHTRTFLISLYAAVVQCCSEFVLQYPSENSEVLSMWPAVRKCSLCSTCKHNIQQCVKVMVGSDHGCCVSSSLPPCLHLSRPFTLFPLFNLLLLLNFSWQFPSLSYVSFSHLSLLHNLRPLNRCAGSFPHRSESIMVESNSHPEQRLSRSRSEELHTHKVTNYQLLSKDSQQEWIEPCFGVSLGTW